jgi:hypothetical protein
VYGKAEKVMICGGRVADEEFAESPRACKYVFAHPIQPLPPSARDLQSKIKPGVKICSQRGTSQLHSIPPLAGGGGVGAKEAIDNISALLRNINEMDINANDLSFILDPLML